MTPEGSAFKKDIVMRSEVLFVADRSNYRTVGVPKHMHNENWGIYESQRIRPMSEGFGSVSTDSPTRNPNIPNTVRTTRRVYLMPAEIS